MLVDKLEQFCLNILKIIGLKKLAEWYMDHQEGMRYLIFGALSTVANIVAYTICYYLLHLSNAGSNIVAWIVAVTFAYITNKLYVFHSKSNGKLELLKEMFWFILCRIFTLIIDEAIMIITVDKLAWNAFFMKILANIIVIILNFIFSKVLIFKKQKNN